jgi:hypothetical protein
MCVYIVLRSSELVISRKSSVQFYSTVSESRTRVNIIEIYGLATQAHSTGVIAHRKSAGVRHMEYILHSGKEKCTCVCTLSQHYKTSMFAFFSW